MTCTSKEQIAIERCYLSRMRRVDGTLPNLEVFCRTFETGSFTKASEMLGLTPQAASRAVARLEADLGVVLFRRTTRSLAPTEEGRRYHARAHAALALLAEAEREISHKRRSPSGLVRVSMPTTYGHHRLLPSLGRFRALYPDIELVCHVSNRNVDFVRESFDLSVRMGESDDASLVRRKLGDFALGVFASPSYLARRRAPETLAELDAHAAIAFVMPATGRVLPWTFVEPGGTRASFVPPNAFRIGGDVLGVVTAATGGAGLVQTYDYLVEREVARGELVEVLSRFRGGSRPFSLVYPKAPALSRAARTFADFVVAEAKPHVRART